MAKRRKAEVEIVEILDDSDSDEVQEQELLQRCPICLDDVHRTDVFELGKHWRQKAWLTTNSRITNWESYCVQDRADAPHCCSSSGLVPCRGVLCTMCVVLQAAHMASAKGA